MTVSSALLTWKQIEELKPKEYCYVVQLANNYCAIHVKDGEKACLDTDFLDLKTVQIAAKTFAEAHKIVYSEELQKTNERFITTIEYRSKDKSVWLPMEIFNIGCGIWDAKCLEYQKRWPKRSKPLEREQAIKWAKEIASKQELEFLTPSPGFVSIIRDVENSKPKHILDIHLTPPKTVQKECCIIQ